MAQNSLVLADEQIQIVQYAAHILRDENYTVSEGATSTETASAIAKETLWIFVIGETLRVLCHGYANPQSFVRT